MIRDFQKTDKGSVGAVLTGFDGAQDVPSFVENALHDTAVPNLQKDCENVWY